LASCIYAAISLDHRRHGGQGESAASRPEGVPLRRHAKNSCLALLRPGHPMSIPSGSIAHCCVCQIQAAFLRGLKRTPTFVSILQLSFWIRFTWRRTVEKRSFLPEVIAPCALRKDRFSTPSHTPLTTFRNESSSLGSTAYRPEEVFDLQRVGGFDAETRGPPPTPAWLSWRNGCGNQGRRQGGGFPRVNEVRPLFRQLERHRVELLLSKVCERKEEGRQEASKYVSLLGGNPPCFGKQTSKDLKRN
jgi:hypothetical protein